MAWKRWILARRLGRADPKILRSFGASPNMR